jgi:hypothetical protein
MEAESVPTDRYVLYMPDFDPIFSTVRRDDSPPFRLWSDPLTPVWMWRAHHHFLARDVRELHIIQRAVMQSMIFRFSRSQQTRRPARSWSKAG